MFGRSPAEKSLTQTTWSLVLATLNKKVIIEKKSLLIGVLIIKYSYSCFYLALIIKKNIDKFPQLTEQGNYLEKNSL